MGIIFFLGFEHGLNVANPDPAHSIRIDVEAGTALRLLGAELKEYSKSHGGKLPASLAELRDSIPLLDPFTSSQREFKYAGSGWTWKDFDGDNDRILAYTDNRRGDEHQYALFSDGGASRLSKSELARELRKLTSVNLQHEQQKAQ